MPLKSPTTERMLFESRKVSFLCHKCQQRALSSVSPKRPATWLAQSQYRQSRSRRASAISPVSIVNGTKNILPVTQKIYDTLRALEQEAAAFTDLSQLQLALRGLESENAITRIAILGVNGTHDARRLARILLADPLDAEPAWEKQLAKTDNDERAILLRYGESLDYDQRHPLLRTWTVPSTTLQTHRLEILIQGTASNAGNVEMEPHEFLIPGLEMANSSAARYSVVRYPVHKALILSDGLSDLSAHFSLTMAQSPENEMLQGAVITGWINTLEQESKAMVMPVNIDHAEIAISTFRQSIDNSVSYEHTWFSSGVTNLSAWLLTGLDPTPGTLKTTVRNLIYSLLSTTSSRIQSSEADYLQTTASKAITFSTRSELSKALTAWSERAHTELRDHLSLAFSSPSWRKLAWWKLLWRVDDVGMITADILQRSWLQSAEKELIWLVGRIEQAGLFIPQMKKRPTSSPKQGPKLDVHASAFAAAIVGPPDPDIAVTLYSSMMGIPPPPSQNYTDYPQTISRARDALSSTTIPPLQSLAQSLLLHSFSTTVLTSSLSALVYLSISTTSLYEAGTIAALGLVYSAQRLQRRWEGARRVWMETIREKGRSVLRHAEAGWSGYIERGGAEAGDGGPEAEERRVAREAVQRVRDALDESQLK
ncbi:MAG: hypothetical protein Q9195_004093 [Heterodermia aff. obscurata]